VKARLGRSPNRADAFVYMLAGLRMLKGTARTSDGFRRFDPEPMDSSGPPPNSYDAMRLAFDEEQRRKQDDGWGD
jgi:hypothetical protein